MVRKGHIAGNKNIGVRLTTTAGEDVHNLKSKCAFCVWKDRQGYVFGRGHLVNAHTIINPAKPVWREIHKPLLWLVHGIVYGIYARNNRWIIDGNASE
jgi:hypothetical protein